MSHSRWSDVRRQLGSDGRARVDVIVEWMALGERRRVRAKLLVAVALGAVATVLAWLIVLTPHVR